MDKDLTFKHLVSLQDLESASHGSLERLLRPHGEYLRSRGVPFDEHASGAIWIRNLHRVLCAVDPEMPSALQLMLVEIGDVVNAHGHDLLVELAREQQLSLFSAKDSLTVFDIAIKACLDYPNLFRAVHSRVQSAKVTRCVEFMPRTQGLLRDYLNPSRRIFMHRHLSPWLSERNRGTYCDIDVFETDDEVVFQTITGRAPRKQAVIENQQRFVQSVVLDQHNFIKWNRETGKLSVSAPSTAEVEICRRLFGLTFFRNPEHYRVQPIYTAAPILDSGMPSLRHDDVLGLRGATLREVIVDINQCRNTIRDFAFFRRLALRQEDNAVVQFTIWLRLCHRPQPLPIQIAPPNRIDFDQRFMGVVMAFLQAREFLVQDVRSGKRAA